MCEQLKTGLVLSGGGARAIMHLGAIQALEEHDIGIDHIVGTSAGAVVGALYSQGYSPLECIEILSESRLFRSVKFALGGSGLLRLTGTETFLKQHFPTNDFSSLRIPLTITATDIISAQTIVFESGELLAPMLASCCLPGLFEPYKYAGYHLVDGGVLNNLPVEYLDGKAGFVIGIHCNPFVQTRPLKNSFEVAYRSLLLAVHNQNLSRLKKCDLLIEPPEMSNYTIFDFRKLKAIYKTGYEFTHQLLQTSSAITLKRLSQ